MKGTLGRDIQKIQLCSIAFYSLVVFCLTMVLIWNPIINVYKEHLRTMTRLTSYLILERKELFTTRTPDPRTIRQVLEPDFKKIIACYSREFTLGFYSRELDQVVLSVSKDKSVRLNGTTLPPHDKGRQVWKTRQPAYTFNHLNQRQAWVLKYNEPVIIDGQIIGYSFANISFSGLMNVIVEIFLGLLISFFIGGYVTTAFSNRTKDKIKKNIAQLLITDDHSNLRFDYIEFEVIAEKNQQTHHDLIFAEQQLMKSHQELSDTLESITDIIESFSDGFYALNWEWRFLYINKACEKFLFGQKRENLIGKVIWEEYPQFNNTCFDNHYYQVMKDRMPETFETHSSVDGSWTEIRVYPAKNGILIFITDITERKRIEQELIKTEKLESLGILAGGIAHDFNNYLEAILANIQLGKMLTAKGKNVEPYLEQAADATKRASELTKQLLTFAKGGLPLKKLASIAPLIEDTVRFNLRGSKVRGIFSIPETLWTVEVDAGQIGQVIGNLVMNAVQAMPQGGRLEISAENVTMDRIPTGLSGKYIQITLKDQGIGIPKESIARIFDPFFTTKKEGSGLGLATSYSIIKQHDGFIEVSSIPGQGTTFTLYLPASDMAPVDREVAATRNPVIRGESILFMDDEEMIRLVMGETLTEMGFKVTLAQDGAEAVTCYHRALEEGIPFTVVILDLTIPGGVGGLETMTQLRSLDPDVKAVVSSGYANAPVIAEYEKFGFKGVVSKPYKLDELMAILHHIIGMKDIH